MNGSSAGALTLPDTHATVPTCRRSVHPATMKSHPLIRVFLFLLAAFFSNAGLYHATGVVAEPLATEAPAAGTSVGSPPGSSPDGIGETAQPPSSSRQQEIPAKAQAILKAVQDRGGEPPPGYVGGRTFQNRERKLPRGRYREYDVTPKRAGKDRGTERIVIERRTGRAYYTGNHYRTFIPMN